MRCGRAVCWASAARWKIAATSSSLQRRSVIGGKLILVASWRFRPGTRPRCEEVSDLEWFLKHLQDPATADAMAADGVNRDTVRVFVLDREWHA